MSPHLAPSSGHFSEVNQPQSRVRFLRPEQVTMIDEALTKLGQFGEVRLIVEKGRLRFLVVQQSIDALKWKPGAVSEEIADI